MAKATNHMVEGLEPTDKTFRDTLVGNVRDLVESLKILNFDKDAEIEAMRARLILVSPEANRMVTPLSKSPS